MKAHRLANLAENVNINEAKGIDNLKKVGIKTMADLDKYIKKNPLPNGDLESRYGTLKKLVGEKAADKIMHELMVQSWKMGKKGFGEENENLNEIGTLGDVLKSKQQQKSNRHLMVDSDTDKIAAIGSYSEIADKIKKTKVGQYYMAYAKPNSKVGGIHEENENLEEVAPAQVEATDPDGEMALTQLKNVVNKAVALTKMIQPNSKLEPWVQSKITLADDYVTTIHDYIKNTPGAVGEAFEDFEEGTIN